MKPATRWTIAGGAVALIVGFLLFRPDTLVTNVAVDEPLSAAFATTTTSPTPASPSLSPPTTAQASVTTNPGPIALGMGMFSGINHSASGSVAIYQQDGQHVLRFEDDTDIQNGPDLYVWLLPSTSYTEGTPTEYIDLGTLKGNVGGQNYLLPPEFDPDLHQAVLIWCLRFDVPFATAPLA